MKALRDFSFHDNEPRRDRSPRTGEYDGLGGRQIVLSVQELEKAVSELPPRELAAFVVWFEEFLAGHWDQPVQVASSRERRLKALQEVRENLKREGPRSLPLDPAALIREDRER